MKTLLLMRHAKSDWGAANTHDHERPINARGRRAASAMGRWLARIDQVPEAVITSTAVRARTTVETAAHARPWTCRITAERALYGADPRTVLEVVCGADESYERVMVAGHEPGMPLTLSCLLGDAPLRFPTAAIARVDLLVDRWSDVRPGDGQLVWFLPPRLLECAD